MLRNMASMEIREKSLKCNCIDYGENVTKWKSYLLMRWIHLYIGTTKYQLLTISLTLFVTNLYLQQASSITLFSSHTHVTKYQHIVKNNKQPL
jgi:hypothetical protein